MKVKSAPHIFDPLLLKEKIAESDIELLPDFDEKLEVFKRWSGELESGKISLSKEEEIKPRFLIDVFGKVLGFNLDNPESWSLSLEHKTLIDSTKTDASIGSFSIGEDGVKGKVIAVVEIKNANTDLDKKLGPKKISAVEQAFAYAPKLIADWIFVSNFKEIRFYHPKDAINYELFRLEDLVKTEYLKKFLFLFHRHGFIHTQKSRTQNLYELNEGYSKKYESKRKNQKKEHVVDEMFKSLKQFEGFGCIDPFIIANTYPFNLLDDYVWHYDKYNLFTINPEIFQFISNMSIKEGKLILTQNLKKELATKKVRDYETKIHYIIETLNHSLIYHISAIRDYEKIVQRNKNQRVIGFSIRHAFRFSDESNEGISRSIYLGNVNKCECLSCSFKELDLKYVLKILKKSERPAPSLELGFGNYLVAANGYCSSYYVYTDLIKNLEDRAGKQIELYIAYNNLSGLLNIFSHHDEEVERKIRKHIQAIDLEDIIWTRLTHLKKDELKAIRELRDDTLIQRVKKNVEETLEEFEKIKAHYDKGGTYSVIGNYTLNLFHEFNMLYAWVHRNYLVKDVFNDYRNIVAKVFQGMIISHQLEKYPYHLKEFERFLLLEVIINIPTDNVDQILKNVKSIKVNDKDVEDILIRMTRYFNSFIAVGPFDNHLDKVMSEFIVNYDFSEKCGRIFGNFFKLFSRVQIEGTQFNQGIKQSLINFLRVENFLYWFHMKVIGEFLEVKGNFFHEQELIEILKIANSKNRYGYNKYQHLIRSSCISLSFFYPGKTINEKSFVQLALANSMSEDDRMNYSELIHLWKAVGESNKLILKETFEKSLDSSFNADLYEKLLREHIIDINNKEYFEIYVKFVNKARGKGFVQVVKGVPEFEDYQFYNFVLLIYQLGVAFDDVRLKNLNNLSSFEAWILNPVKFDYTNFNAEWLLAVNYSSFLNQLRRINKIGEGLNKHLNSEYNQKLAQIYFVYFGQSESK
jgi:hypothetical protein